ncbi:hypothetical protein [Streptomyces sp. NPDC048392]|uniref:hypothetical protein n=1 Tax=Streptomyces sp. NPDC048392 TaxID=3365543 RepID=UPI00370FBCEC
MTDHPSIPAAEPFELLPALLRQAAALDAQRDGERLARHQWQQEADQRRQAEEAARGNWFGGRRSSRMRSARRRRG